MYSILPLALFLSTSQALPSIFARDPLNDCPSDPGVTTTSTRICTSTCSADRPGGDYSNTYTGSFAGCVSACSSDPQCATAQYHEENGYCYLKSTVNALSTGSGTDTVDCCPPVTTVGNRICTPTCGQDRPGGDYSATYTGTVDGCIQACGSDAKCVTAQFSLQNGYCYLKDSSHDFSANLNVDSIDCCPTPVTANGRTCTTTCGQDRPGGDYAAVYTGSVDACITTCNSDSNCVTAQYHIENGYCYLKNSANALVAALGTDTVDCS